MRLDRGRWPFKADAFDHIRVQRSLDQILDALQLLRLRFEILDKEAADDLPFTLWVRHAL